MVSTQIAKRAIIASVIASGMFVAPATAQDQSGTPQSNLTYPQVDCAVEPMALDELTALDRSAKEMPDDAYPASFIRELPAGSPAGSETAEAITDAVLEWAACNRDNDYLRLFALFTDNYVRVLAGITDEPLQALATPAVEDPTNQSVEVAAIRDITLLDDRRVSVIVTLSGVEDSHPAPGRTFLLIFVEQNDRWLLDGQYERVWSGGPTDQPVYVADAAATPADTRATPDP